MSLIGMFLLAEDGNVCFAQFGDHRRFHSLRIVPPQLCVVVLSDGSEDMFVHEIEHAMWTALRSAPDILIAHVADDGQLIEEYCVPVASVL